MSKLLVCTYCLDNGWYGDRHRVILSGVFRTMTEARKFTARLKKYVKNVHKVDPKTMDISCGVVDDYPEYTYVSLGPSLSYKHHEISTDELIAHIEEETVDSY